MKIHFFTWQSKHTNHCPAPHHPPNTTMSSPTSVSSSVSLNKRSENTPPILAIQNRNHAAVCDLSDITVSTNISLSAAKMQIHVLLAKNKELSDNLIIYKNRAEDLTDKLSYANQHLERTYSCKSRGKNQFSKRIRDEEIEHAEDQMNVIYVNEIITKLFQGHKFKPEGFQLWTMEPGSICHTITQNGNIGWPREFPKERYWSENIVPMVNAKYCNLVNNVTQKMRSRYIGMC